MTARLMKTAQRQIMFERFAAANPNPTTELEYTTAFELLAAVLLSAQATDKSVNLATRKLFAVANTPQAIAALGVEGLEPFIKTIGLFRAKARHLVATANLLVQNHQGQVPNSREALEALPGVGRKTANVILHTDFGQPTMAVDTPIFRMGNRTGLAPGRTVLQVEEGLLQRIPAQYLHNAHHWLILHGRYVCKARKPACPACIVQDLCCYKQKTI